uniref:Uncharacterized protein n=1 Tax=Anguilla anguilla TaxID=7936 RepID=A0A0E9V5E5_ANGAN
MRPHSVSLCLTLTFQ